MNSKTLRERVIPFQKVSYFDDEDGYIVWRRGTGDNVELLHIKATELRHGIGKRLLREMLKRLNKRPPYCTVFGFTRIENKISHAFYKAMGFDLTIVKGVYQDGHAVVFSQTFAKLKELHNV